MIINLLWALVFATFGGFALYAFTVLPQAGAKIIVALANALFVAALVIGPGSIASSHVVLQGIVAGICFFPLAFFSFSLLAKTSMQTADKLKQEAEALRTQAEAAIEASKEVPKKVYVLEVSALLAGDMVNFFNALSAEEKILIPRFVMSEVQKMTSSDDVLLSAQGTYATQIIERLQKESLSEVKIGENEYANVPDLGTKIIEAVKDVQGILLCANHNLSRLAEQSGIQVVFIPNMLESLQPIHFVGQKLLVKVSTRGQEAGQGIGFLEDGTKVVVEGGEHFLEQNVNVQIQRVYQTVAGKMIFATVES